MAIQTQGKRDPTVVAKAERRAKRQAARLKKPSKTIDKLTAKEKQDTLDAMLEWWLSLEEE